MRHSTRAVLSVGAVVFVTAACNSVLGIPEVTRLEDGTTPTPDPTTKKPAQPDDVECDDNQKACAGKCVAKDDPATGCAADDCNPCSQVHATTACKDGACTITACNDGFNDCDDQPSTGCESDPRTDKANCGACKTSCGTLACVDSECKCTLEGNDCGHGGTCKRSEGDIICICGEGGDRDECDQGIACSDETTCVGDE